MNRKRILVFGDSNSWGFAPCAANETTTRYDASVRWPSVMANRLGSAFELVEEALSARTTDLDDSEIDLPSAHLRGAPFNGAKLLPAILASNLPLDLVVIMLGTNDLKVRFKRTRKKSPSPARVRPPNRRVRGRCGHQFIRRQSSPNRPAASGQNGLSRPGEWAGRSKIALN